ncbi:MAG: hypothetical protein CM1200mP9_11530 [Gammaproteobacteria bacterium]|nr:MAG: hypothetical protein CM1200mP9_11530 [Gammaproteobacteria bacterium]
MADVCAWAGGNSASWWQQVPYFFDDYDIVTFDHRAFGRSRCRDEDFDPDLFVDDLRCVLDRGTFPGRRFVVSRWGSHGARFRLI